MKYLPWILAAIILIMLGILIFVPAKQPQPNNGNNNVPGTNNPAPTSTSNGDTGNNDRILYDYTSLKGKIVRSYIAPNQLITSPIRIEGNVPAGWAFEASFPVNIIDSNGKILAQAPASVPNWMTTSTSAWYGITISYSGQTSSKGYILLKKDNPSGLPEQEDEVRIPVSFR